MNIEELGHIIRKRRLHLRVKQQELADLAGVGINTLVAIERGQGNPKWSTVMALFGTLGIDVDIKY